MTGRLRRLRKAFIPRDGLRGDYSVDGEADGDADRCLTWPHLLRCIEKLYFAVHSPCVRREPGAFARDGLSLIVYI